MLRQADLPGSRVHHLRQPSISMLLENGTPVNTVLGRAGHSKGRTLHALAPHRDTLSGTLSVSCQVHLVIIDLRKGILYSIRKDGFLGTGIVTTLSIP